MRRIESISLHSGSQVSRRANDDASGSESHVEPAKDNDDASGSESLVELAKKDHIRKIEKTVGSLVFELNCTTPQ